MSDEQQKQYDRFITAGYTPHQAAQLIKRGAWLQTGDEQDETWADIRRYREEVAAQAERIAASV
jgi:hypothetical protein